MASRYWVGGSDTWDATAGTKWATTSGGAGGAAVPTTSDDVFFDANSGTVTVTVGTNISVLNLSLNNFTGTFDANDYDLTLRRTLFNTTGPTVYMGSGTWTLTATSANIWSCVSGVVLNCETSTIKMTGTITANSTFVGGGKTYYNVWNATSGAFALIVTGSNTFNDFKIDAGREMNFTTGTTQTVTTFTATGTSGNEIVIDSTTTGTHALVKSGGGTISCDYMNIQHSVATPANTWYAGHNSTNNQADATAGSGWNFNSPPITMAVTVGSFTLTGVSNIITRTINLTTTVGTFILTGIDVALGRFLTMTANVATYALTWLSLTITPHIRPPTHGRMTFSKQRVFYKNRR